MSKCTECKEYDKEKHYCPRWCDVIKNTIDDAREDERERCVEELTLAMSKSPFFDDKVREVKVWIANQQMKGEEV